MTTITCFSSHGANSICALPLVMASTAVRVEAEDRVRCVTAEPCGCRSHLQGPTFCKESVRLGGESAKALAWQLHVTAWPGRDDGNVYGSRKQELKERIREPSNCVIIVTVRRDLHHGLTCIDNLGSGQE